VKLDFYTHPAGTHKITITESNTLVTYEAISTVVLWLGTLRQLPPPKLSENLRPEMHFRGKIKIMSTYNILCWKLAAICHNSVENF